MKEFVCIICPKGCRLKVSDDLKVSGNTCKRGEKYALDEVTHPMRNITSTVKIISSSINRLPVKTSGDIPKEKMFDVMDEINKVVCKAPIKMHDVIIKNVLNLGVDVIATRTILK
ncbi:MAG: DUF1667 domain-containing protein [Bacilli bacterium]|nr:DUF1667 domain-containing protein [Bacilli bacterium]